jgi:hypothetical protein
MGLRWDILQRHFIGRSRWDVSVDFTHTIWSERQLEPTTKMPCYTRVDVPPHQTQAKALVPTFLSSARTSIRQLWCRASIYPSVNA